MTSLGVILGTWTVYNDVNMLLTGRGVSAWIEAKRITRRHKCNNTTTVVNGALLVRGFCWRSSARNLVSIFTEGLLTLLVAGACGPSMSGLKGLLAGCSCLRRNMLRDFIQGQVADGTRVFPAASNLQSVWSHNTHSYSAVPRKHYSLSDCWENCCQLVSCSVAPTFCLAACVL